MDKKLCDSVFISCKHGEPGYNVIQFTNNLEDENHLFVSDIDRWLGEHYSGIEFWYTFDYSDGSSHVILGTWNSKSRLFDNVKTNEIQYPYLAIA